MVSLSPRPVDAPESHELLAEYFAMRAEIFPGGTYRTVFPDPSAFVSPAGVFVVATADEADALEITGPVGCGGIRRISDGPHGVRYEVKHLYLRPQTRGRGWGRLILDGLEADARALGAAELVLDTHHTLDAAGALYAASGFISIEPYNDNANATRWYSKVL